MKNLFLKSATSLFVTILFITGCSAQKYNKIKGSGKLIHKTRSVGSFEEVAVSGSFDVYLVQGNEGKIDMKIEDNLLPYLETEVKDGKLKVKWKNGANISTKKEVVVTVYFKDIRAVSLAGSGDVVGKDIIKADHFVVAVAGSGDIALEVECNTYKASVSGSGDLTLKGKANEFHAGIAGSGDISAYGLSSEKANISISGSGGVNLTVHKELVARISGSGDVKYKGDPKVEDIKVSGSGDVKAY